MKLVWLQVCKKHPEETEVSLKYPHDCKVKYAADCIVELKLF